MFFKWRICSTASMSRWNDMQCSWWASFEYCHFVDLELQGHLFWFLPIWINRAGPPVGQPLMPYTPGERLEEWMQNNANFKWLWIYVSLVSHTTKQVVPVVKSKHRWPRIIARLAVNKNTSSQYASRLGLAHSGYEDRMRDKHTWHIPPVHQVHSVHTSKCNCFVSQRYFTTSR